MRLSPLFAFSALVFGLAQEIFAPGRGAAAGGPSHLAPHLRPHAPPPLLEPLTNDTPGVLKGWNAEAEARLLARLREVGLSQRVVKVGVLDAAGIRLAAVKLQAGEWSTGVFSVAGLNHDAARVLETCFSPPTRADHVDVWSAVPYTGPEGIKWHWPVFSVSCWRKNFLLVVGKGLAAAELLGRVSLVRYDPLFLKYSTGGQLPPAEMVFDEKLPELTGPAPANVYGQKPVQAIVRGPAASRMVAVTIDDGPHPVMTPLILHILKQAHAHATFFVVGEKILQYPQLFMDIVSAGHEVGNHAFTNRRLVEEPPGQAEAELMATSRLIERLGHARPRIMRPPGGEVNEAVLGICARLGLTPVFWSKNTGDWRRQPAAEIARAALDGVRPGDIILMHQGRPESALALREILAGLRRMGLEPVRIQDMLRGAEIAAGTPGQVMARLKEIGLGRE